MTEHLDRGRTFGQGYTFRQRYNIWREVEYLDRGRICRQAISRLFVVRLYSFKSDFISLMIHLKCYII